MATGKKNDFGSFKLLTDEVKEKVLQIWKDYHKEESEGDWGSFEVIVSTEDVDRDGEVIQVDGWDFVSYMKNPVVLWAHDFYSMPIGKTMEIEKTEKGIVAKGVFAPTEKGQEVRKAYDQKFLNAVSPGFIPRDREGNMIKRAELLEISFVPIPANPQAMAVRRAVEELSAKMIKTAVPSHEPSKADEGMEWDSDAAQNRLQKWASSDGSGEPDKMDWSKYSQAFAWYDSENKETFGAYKLPHHDIVDEEFKVVWRGVAAAMAALLGGRGGVDIPEADADRVYSHLSKHYKQFDKEVPEKSAKSMKITDEERVQIEAVFDDMASQMASMVVQMREQVLGMFEGDGVHEEENGEKMAKKEKIGRVLSGTNRKLIGTSIETMRNAVKALEDLIEATEPEKSINQIAEKAESKKAIESTREELVLAAIRAADKALGLTLRELKSDRDKKL